MPQGPFGGPRITELLPFSSDEVEVEFEEKRESNAMLQKQAEDLLTKLEDRGEEFGRWTKVDRRVIVRQKPDPSPSSILDEIKEQVSALGDRAVAITYYIFDNEVGYIASTRTSPNFRRRGLASTLRSEVLEDMERLGVERAYSYPSSGAGEELAISQGFSWSDVEGYLVREF